jgi:hypothetical protein
MRAVVMIQALESHIQRVLPRDWTTVVEDTKPHGNKTVNVAEVLNTLLYGILSGSSSLRELETPRELKGAPRSDTTMGDLLTRLSVGSLPELIARMVKEAIKSKELVPEQTLGGLHIVAIDGKNLWTSRAKATEPEQSVRQRTHMALRAALVSTSVTQVLGQRFIPKSLLKPLSYYLLLMSLSLCMARQAYSRQSLLMLALPLVKMRKDSLNGVFIT